ncbi:hypothetical protein METSCH_B10500 [Metschnikowia aff. pulcherrima]|uniref:Uncharacterized protein n=1 Tax=Metschnikowia aff. pulcherrima TaxID=2163413 RepID=A0A4P6XKH7_9ASCO|nr:hypothetical protein METSCH_B10500 [Metschnikowia aff. pulcherrima]
MVAALAYKGIGFSLKWITKAILVTAETYIRNLLSESTLRTSAKIVSLTWRLYPTQTPRVTSIRQPFLRSQFRVGVARRLVRGSFQPLLWSLPTDTITEFSLIFPLSVPPTHLVRCLKTRLTTPLLNLSPCFAFSLAAIGEKVYKRNGTTTNSLINMFKFGIVNCLV